MDSFNVNDLGGTFVYHAEITAISGPVVVVSLRRIGARGALYVERRIGARGARYVTGYSIV